MPQSQQSKTDSDGPIRLLIVDDDPLVRSRLGRALARRSFSIEYASTKKDALAALATSPHVIVLDVLLPDGSGVDVARAAAALHPVPRIVAVTGAATPLESFELARMGVSEFVSKPYTSTEVESAIRRALSQGPDIKLTGSLSVGVVGLVEARDAIRRSMAVEALAQADGNLTKAAELLGVSRQAVQRLAKSIDDGQ